MGNFDDDTDEELLLLADPDLPEEQSESGSGREAIRTGASLLLEADGQRSELGIRSFFFVADFTAWDYDGDGVDEIIPADTAKGYYAKAPEQPAILHDKFDLDNCSPVLALDGSCIAVLRGGGTWQDVTVGDFDGDGSADLLLCDYGGTNLTARAYAVGGIELPVAEGAVLCCSDLAADMDGDGKDEVAGTFGALSICDPAATWRDLPGYEIQSGSTYAADLDGDGAEELLSGAGIYDVQTAKWLPLVYPAQANLPDKRFPACAAGDFDGDGTPELAVLNGEFSQGSGLYLFLADGQCSYYEELGFEVRTLHSLHAGGRDHLIVDAGLKGLYVFP